ncbi:MAG: HgcAB-associated protein [Candidatus Eremiobacterota bacterium]
MTKKKEDCCAIQNCITDCCKLEALITVDERGQMVLPKELRDKASIKTGDRLAVISMMKEGKVCCLSLIKADDFGSMIREFLGPLVKEIIKDDK